jgi:hypothetical protein
MKVSDVRTVVIYEPLRGHIYHVHHEVTVAGAESIPDDELARRALSRARASLELLKTAIPKRLETLQVDPKDLAVETALRVDPKRRILIAAKSRAGSRPANRRRATSRNRGR